MSQSMQARDVFGPGYDLYEGFDMKKWDLDKQTNGWSNPEVDRIYDQVVHNAYKRCRTSHDRRGWCVEGKILTHDGYIP